ncbi:glycosyltransferase [Solidesulfovibrio sp.]|uniref:glycosyltransferase n=1 Tax=Solidesulfovibrio sp. TaxID=2910990 RepID=UPI002628C8FA|nr:glycosyltransferase [Solidesulfovibrio sp.]
MGPYDFFLPPVFDALPEAVADRLLAGVFGRKQAAQTGLAALRAAPEAGAQGALLARLGLELSLLAFDLDPGNAALAQGILALAGQVGAGLPPDALAALRLASGEGLGPDWRAALAEAGRTGDWEGFCRRLEAGHPALATPLASRLAGLAALAAGDGERIATWRESLPAGPLTPGLAFLRARAALRLDGREAGLAALRGFLGRYPWCAQTLLSLHDLLRGRDAALTPLPGRLAILLYSWNKAGELGRTLEGILAGDLPDFHIFALDNGSTDATPDVLAAFAARLGPGRFTALGAPVNVGAPAGRNWLKHLPEVLACDFAAYVDDDASLPRDWALRFGAAVAAYPQAGVYGCRVHDAGRPAALQAAEFHVEPAGPGEGIAASDLQLQAPDVGQFAYCRPAVSVTGCCHLFPTKALADGGDFDIRFSPSQFDDFDRDLRAALAGSFAVCQGHLAVGHLRASGGDAARRRAAGANAHGNMQKLQGKYDAGDVRRLRREQRNRLLTDLRKKAIWLARHDPGGERDKEGDA